MIKFNSIRFRIVFYFSVFMVVLTGCVGAILFALFSRSAVEAKQTHMENAAGQIVLNMDSYFSEIEMAMNSYSINETITDALNSYPDNPLYVNMNNITRVTQIINPAVIQKQGISSIYIFSPEGAFYSCIKGNSISRDGSYFSDVWERSGVRSSYEQVYSAPHIPQYYNSGVTEKLVTISMPVFAFRANPVQGIGVVAVNVDMASIAENIGKSVSGLGYRVIIVNSADTVIYSDLPGVGELERYDPALLSGGDTKMFTTSRQSEVNDWTYLLIGDYNEIQSSTALTFLIIIGSIAVAVAISTVFSAIITTNATASIKRLTGYMSIIEQGNFDLEIAADKSCEEMNVLYSSLARMAKRIDILIKECYIKEVREHEAKFESLQSKIEPHFLNNTLQMITSLAVLEKNEEIQIVSSKLADLLSYVIYEKNRISVAQELAYITDYIDIQNVRYSGRFRFETDIPGEVLRMQIPKLLFQPIVENSVLHGFERQKPGEPCVISITARIGGGAVTVEFYDNGAGIEPERLAYLNEVKLQSGNGVSEKSIGLSNIQNRIHLSYSDAYGLAVESRAGEYTLVRMTIPYGNEERDVPC